MRRENIAERDGIEFRTRTREEQKASRKNSSRRGYACICMRLRGCVWSCVIAPGCDRSNILNEPKKRYPPLTADWSAVRCNGSDSAKKNKSERERERERVRACVYIVYNSDLRHWAAINVINGRESLTILILSRCNRNNKVLLYPHSLLSFFLSNYHPFPVSPSFPSSSGSGILSHSGRREAYAS